MKSKSMFFIINMFLLVFAFGIVSAAKVDITTSVSGLEITNPPSTTHQIGEDFQLNIKVYNISNGVELNNDSLTCMVTLQNPNGFIVSQDNLTYNESVNFFQLYLPGENFIEENSGQNYYIISCNDGIDGFVNGGFYLTNTGDNPLAEKSFAYLFIGIIFTILFLTIIHYRSKFDEDKWYSKMKRQYEDKNFFKLVINGIGYSFLKNMYVIYYSLGFIILTLIADTSFTYNIVSLYETMKTLLYIYAWGFALIGLLFLSKIQELIMYFVDELKNEKWGIKKNGK